MTHFSVLFVCTGNICRSPTADGVLRQMVLQAGLSDRITVDSAGTTDYHVGEPPDRRAQQHAKKRGYDLSTLRAREVVDQDFSRFDLVLAMDAGHLAHLRRRCPSQLQSKVQLFLAYADQCDETDVPDPYYGGADGFERVLDLVEGGCSGVLKFAQAQLNAESL
ncbi:low molecular weight phosphotyrosine protein phosphatase [Chitinibacter fontanus]|uniref:protein-tyrosine-phosphatase n=1 Tax=Chitinibacter fontanus TaxID=1737446 RepID=A0A7D5VCW1_9NEIS|nr:low molecular weight phosphotyrosine protein phosphatase [Chitinibacter fontanus]